MSMGHSAEWGHQGPTWRVLKRDERLPPLPGWGWSPGWGQLTGKGCGLLQPAPLLQEPCLWTALLPLTGASHHGRLGDSIVPALSMWMERSQSTETRQSDVKKHKEISRDEKGEVETREVPRKMSD